MKEKRIARNTAVLSGSAIASHIISILFSFALTRVFSKGEIGEWTTFVAFSSLLSTLCTLKLENAIVLSNKDEEVSEIVRSVLFVSSFLVLTIYIIILIIGSANGGYNMRKGWLLEGGLTCLSAFGTCIYKAFNSLCLRENKLGYIVKRNILNAVLSGTIEVTLGFYHVFSSNNLIIGATMGTFLSSLYLAFSSSMNSSKPFSLKECFATTINTIKRYDYLPRYSLGGDMLNQLSNSLPSILLRFFYGSEVAAFFSLGYQLLSLPISLIGGAVGQALYPASVIAQKNNNIGWLLESVLGSLLLIGFVPISLVSACAPALFDVFYGSSWSIAGSYVRYITFWIIAAFIVSPITVVTDTLRLNKEFFVYNLALCLSRVMVLVIGGVLINEKATVFLYGLVGGLYQLIILWIILNASGIATVECIKRLLLSLMKLVLLYLLPACVINSMEFEPQVKIICSVAIGIWFLFREKNTLLSIFRSTGVNYAQQRSSD